MKSANNSQSLYWEDRCETYWITNPGTRGGGGGGGYKRKIMLNSTEHEISTALKKN